MKTINLVSKKKYWISGILLLLLILILFISKKVKEDFVTDYLGSITISDVKKLSSYELKLNSTDFSLFVSPNQDSTIFSITVKSEQVGTNNMMITFLNDDINNSDIICINNNTVCNASVYASEANDNTLEIGGAIYLEEEQIDFKITDVVYVDISEKEMQLIIDEQFKL